MSSSLLVFLYKPKFKNLPSITIMDGPFYPLYEWNKEFFNLYSVKDSKIITTKNLVLAKKKIAQLDTKKKFLLRKKIMRKMLIVVTIIQSQNILEKNKY